MVHTKPTLIELDMSQLEDALRRAEERLDEPDYAMLKALAESYAYLSELVGDNHTTIARLRKLLFGAKTETTAAVVGGRAESEERSSRDEAASPETPERSGTSREGQAGGHGRHGADAYTGAEKIEVRHASLAPGDSCPECREVTVYETHRPGFVVRLVGQPPVGAKVYYLQKLRCNLCGKVFTAQAPESAGAEKYAPTVGPTIALLSLARIRSIVAKLQGPWACPCQLDAVDLSTPWPSCRAGLRELTARPPGGRRV